MKVLIGMAKFNNIIENEGELREVFEILELTLRRARVKTHSISELYFPLC